MDLEEKLKPIYNGYPIKKKFKHVLKNSYILCTSVFHSLECYCDMLTVTDDKVFYIFVSRFENSSKMLLRLLFCS